MCVRVRVRVRVYHSWLTLFNKILHVCFLCLESETGHNDGSVLSLYPEHIRYHSVCPVCVGCWNSWLGGVFLHRVNVLQLCKCCCLTTIAFSALTLLVGCQEEQPACKNE